jgi:hypothetical protein
MRIELNDPGTHTRLQLSDVEWGRVLQRLSVGEEEIPFLSPVLMGHHFFTGSPASAGAYEPHESPGTLTRTSDRSATWHQPETPHTRVETHTEFEIVGPGMVELRFRIRSHAASYPHGTVGLFWGTVFPHGGQRGMHLLLPGAEKRLRWHYFQGGGDCWSCRANTVLGPDMPPAPHDPDHPPTYFFAEASHRFALPIQIGRWRDLFCGLEIDTADVAFTDVLLATAIGGPSWDVYWRLHPGESRAVCCRLTVGRWPGWKAIEERYRAWHGCVDRSFVVDREADDPVPLARPLSVKLASDSGLALSRKLFEQRGQPLLARLGLLDRCTVGCVGGTSQNARLDDSQSRDHWWGPHLTFLLRQEDWEAHAPRLREAIAAMPDEVDGQRWRGYDGPEPRKTSVVEMGAYLQMLTGLEKRPETDREWLPYLTRSGFLGTRWTERLFDAGQGELFHDPDKQFTERWRHWTAYVPPDIHRALLARSLFRVWNAGPEYNLKRLHARGDALATALCRARFIDEVIELAFCWNEQFVPPFKWRAAQFRRLPICPTAVRDGIDALAESDDRRQGLKAAGEIVTSIKRLMRDLYHLSPGLKEDLSTFAHAMRDQIEDAEVRRQTPLDW